MIFLTVGLTWYWVLILLLIGFIAGYIMKDQTTDEVETNIEMKRPKIKGGGNMDLGQAVTINSKKLSLAQRIRKKRENRKTKKEAS